MNSWTRRTALASGLFAAGATAGRIGAQPTLQPSDVAHTPRRSWLDFLPHGQRAPIVDGTSTADLTQPLQRMLDELPAGAALDVPGSVNVEGTLTIRRSITLIGVAGRENFDNSWDRGGRGTEIRYRGSAGDALRIQGAAAPNSCFNVLLRDFIVRGARLNDDGSRNARAGSGDGIAVVGSREETSNIRIDFDNVHVAQAAGHGISLSGHVFGGSIRNATLHRNGGNGLRAVDQGGVGEMWLAHLRLFQNGRAAPETDAGAGLLWAAGALLVSQLSASENAGAGAVVTGGPVQIDMLQLESNGTGVADRAARRQLVLGQPGRGVRSARISAMMSDPGADFRGAHVAVAANASNVALSGFLANELGPGGRHIVRERGSQSLDLTGLAGWRVVDDRAIDTATRAELQVFARLEQAPSERTGDGAALRWRPTALLRNDLNAFDPASGGFRAPLSGLYEVEVAIPLQGLTAQHRAGRLEFRATSVARSYQLGNLGVQADPQGRFTVQGRARIPMQGGETVTVACLVEGGGRTVGTSGDPREGFLTVALV